MSKRDEEQLESDFDNRDKLQRGKKFEALGTRVELSKRFCIPVEIETTCPHCGTKNIDDYEDQYLSYPIINVREQRYVYCDNCEREYWYGVKIGVSLIITNPESKEELIND